MIEIEAPSDIQKQNAALDRLASLYANGMSRSSVEAKARQEFMGEDQDLLVQEVLSRGERLIDQQKKRYLVYGGTIVAVSVVCMALLLLFTGGVISFLPLIPVAFGVYFMTRRGNDPSEYDRRMKK